MARNIQKEKLNNEKKSIASWITENAKKYLKKWLVYSEFLSRPALYTSSTLQRVCIYYKLYIVLCKPKIKLIYILLYLYYNLQ